MATFLGECIQWENVLPSSMAFLKSIKRTPPRPIVFSRDSATHVVHRELASLLHLTVRYVNSPYPRHAELHRIY